MRLNTLLRTLFVVSSFATALLLSGCLGNEHETALPDTCYQAPESGRCKAAFQRYYYDADSDTCRTFIWGGCGGTVPFESMERCVSQCNASPVESKEGAQPGKALPQ